MNNKEYEEVLLQDIIPNRFQPRLAFNERELLELANSIKIHGIIEPLVLRKIGDKYEIIAGERRYKASSMVGLSKVPAIIVDTDDNQSAEIALVENLHRSALTPIEEAQSYKKLMDRGMSQDDIAKRLGIAQPTVANKIRLLMLPTDVKTALLNNKISERHARSLLSLTTPLAQSEVCSRIINGRMTVKETEDYINKITGKTPASERPAPVMPPQTGPDLSSVIKIDNDSNEDPFKEIQRTQEQVAPPQSFQTSEDNIILDNPKANASLDNTPDPFFQNFSRETSYSMNNGPKSIQDAINNTRQLSEKIKSSGFNVDMEEFDFEDMYQIVIKIKKG